MSARSTCVYALRFVLHCYAAVKTREAAVSVQQTVTMANDALLVLDVPALDSPDHLLPEERLVTRTCSRSLAQVLEVWPDRQDFDMREFEIGVGPLPPLDDVQAALTWISGTKVGA